MIAELREDLRTARSLESVMHFVRAELCSGYDNSNN
jgi:hypothetical protein